MITVRDLVAARVNEVTIVAGHSGGDRLVTWAHVCDLPDPWTWVRPGDLVMTTGDGLPAEPEAQAAWFSTLTDVGISALILAPRPGVPAVSPAMLAVADERSVPLLEAEFALEFSGLARTVIESAVQSERDHINTARRLFDVYSEALRSRADLSGRLDVVARSVGWTITVTRAGDGAVVAAGGRGHTANNVISVPVPGRAPFDVQVRQDQRRVLDGSLVHYLAGLVGIELEQQAQAYRERQRRGQVVLQGALDRTVSGAQLRHELDERSMGHRPVVLALLRGAGRVEPDGIDTTLLSDPGVEPLVGSLGQDLVIVAPQQWEDLERYCDALAPEACIGVSAPLAPGADLGEALAQARTAAACATEGGVHMTAYGELDQLGALGPRTVADAQRLVIRVLGALIRQDEATGSELLTSLEVFLRHDRSWVRAAAELGVHRQTLVYRLNQIERLTGLKPTSSSAIASFWAALEAGRTHNLIPEPGRHPAEPLDECQMP